MFEIEYRRLLADILTKGLYKQSRTGRTIGLYNVKLSAEMWKGFPLITGRKMFFKNILAEFQWMLSGSTNVKDLHKSGVHIWDKWADENGNLGPTYGFQIHSEWSKIMELIKTEPTSRRLMINLWDTYLLEEMRLPPCYFNFQFYIHDQLLNLTVSCRSIDMAVGCPYDIAVLSCFLYQACLETGYHPGIVTMNITDAHVNEENIKACDKYLNTSIYKAPTLEVPRFILKDYNCGSHIQMTVKD